MVKELRERTGAGVMECRSILVETSGDMDKAIGILREKGLLRAQKKTERATGQGLVEAYVHTAGRLAAMIEVNCETDFVARTDVFKELAHSLAMQVAALSPKYVSREEMPADDTADPKEACLLLQPFIRDPARTVNDMVVEAIAKTGENIKVRRFIRFELGC
jgi:elongation factor Ts